MSDKLRLYRLMVNEKQIITNELYQKINNVSR